jgi:hypothetical protein
MEGFQMISITITKRIPVGIFFVAISNFALRAHGNGQKIGICFFRKQVC